MININKIYIIILAIYLLDEKINATVGFNGCGFLIFMGLYASKYDYTKISYKAIVFSSIIIYYSLLLIYFSGCEWNYKYFSSILLLIPLIIAINYGFINGIVSSDITSKIALIITIISVILNDILNPGDRIFRLFYENSWTALYIAPFIAYRLLANKKDKYSWLAIIVISTFCFSSTFFILMCLLFFIILSRSNNIIYIVLGALLILFYYSLNNIALMDRVDTVLNYDNVATGNLSSFVWLNGFSMAYQNFMTSSGLGVGLNLMGCSTSSSTNGFFAPVIEEITGGVLLNSEDGSFLSAKLVSELGFLGVLIVLVIVAKSVRNIHLYIFKKSNLDANLDCIVGSIVMLVLLFVRAGGYFQLITILALSLLFSGSKINGQILLESKNE